MFDGLLDDRFGQVGAGVSESFLVGEVNKKCNPVTKGDRSSYSRTWQRKYSRLLSSMITVQSDRIAKVDCS